MADQFFPPLPFITRREYDKSVSFEYKQTSTGAYVAAPPLTAAAITTIQALILAPDQDVTIRLANQSDAGVLVQKGGILLVEAASLDNSGSVAVKVNNNSGATATIRGVALGS